MLEITKGVHYSLHFFLITNDRKFLCWRKSIKSFYDNEITMQNNV